MKKMLIYVLMAMFLTAAVSFAATTGVSLTVGNTAPTIVTVTAPAAQDPTECAATTIPAIRVNVTDPDGWADVNLSASYVNITKSGVTHQASSCVTNVHNGNWIEMNCTGASFAYNDTSGVWNLTAYVKDNAGASITNTTQTLTYNTGILMRTNNAPISFGAVYAGSNDNVNNNAPGFNAENCGNAILNMSITGANITDGGVNSIAAGQFRLDDDATPSQGGGETAKAELTLNTSAQDFSKTGGIALGSTWGLWSFANIPVAQAQAVYNVGTWTLTASAY